MLLNINKKISIIIFLIFISNITVYSQNDWHFINESSSRLPSIISFSFCNSGADLDGDNDIDLIVGREHDIFYNEPGTEVMLLNNGHGYFTRADSLQFPQIDDYTAKVLIFDCDSDGDLDVFVVNANRQTDYLAINNSFGIYNIDWGRVSLDTSVALTADYADIDNDGDIDIVALGNSQGFLPPNRVWINSGQGYLINELFRLPQLPEYISSVRFIDIDNDSDPDILLVYSGQGDYHLMALINDGEGYFTDETPQRLGNAPPSWDLEPSDIDNDGDFDLILNCPNRVGILINNGNGYFASDSVARTPLLPQNVDIPWRCRAFDSDDDGDEDLIVGTIGSDIPDLVYINNVDGYFEDQTNIRWPNQAQSTRDVFVGDLDDDGDADVFLSGTGDCRNEIHINTLDIPDLYPPNITSATELPIVDSIMGPYPIRLVCKDGVGIPYEISVSVSYSIEGYSFQSDSMWYTGAYIYRGYIPTIDSGQTVRYYYHATDKWGNTVSYPSGAPESVLTFTYLPYTNGIDETDGLLPQSISLSAYPNPFNSATTITLIDALQAEIGIYDITGRMIAMLHTVGGQALWDAGAYSSGLYFARLAGEKAGTIKLILLK